VGRSGSCSTSELCAATQSWRSFLDDHDTWLTLSAVTQLYLSFQDSTSIKPRRTN
jgi:hypothetical protein